MDCSPSDSSVHSISQARILEWVAISFSRGPSQPRDQTALIGGFFTAEPPGKPNTHTHLNHQTISQTLHGCPSPWTLPPLARVCGGPNKDFKSHESHSAQIRWVASARRGVKEMRTAGGGGSPPSSSSSPACWALCARVSSPNRS